MPLIRVPLALVLTLFLLSGSSRVAAQEIPSPYRFIETGQEAGAVFGHMNLDAGRFGLGPKSAAFYGGIYTVAVGGPVSLEGTVFIIPTERDIVNPRIVEGDPVLEDPAEVTLVNVSARLRLNLTGRRTWNALQPFAVLGGGVFLDAQGAQAEDQRLEEAERFDFGTEFAGIFGGGARWILNDRMALRGELGITLYQLDVPEGWRDPELGLGNSPENEWVSARTITLGATVLF